MPDNIIHNCKFIYIKTIKNKTSYFLLSLMVTVFIHFWHRKHVSITKDNQLMLLREIITFYCWNLIISIHILWENCTLNPDGIYSYHCALKCCMFKCKGFHSIVFEHPTALAHHFLYAIQSSMQLRRLLVKPPLSQNFFSPSWYNINWSCHQ